MGAIGWVSIVQSSYLEYTKLPTSITPGISYLGWISHLTCWMAPVCSVIQNPESCQEKQDYLVKAHQDAAQKSAYDSQKTQDELTRLFKEHCKGKVPYSWQLDAAESLILGVDSIVIAGTRAGKTMPFVMPLMRDKSKGMLIISPLKALQHDQVSQWDYSERECN